MLKRFNPQLTLLPLLLGLMLPGMGHADDLNGANTAWIITATALVFFMVDWFVLKTFSPYSCSASPSRVLPL